MSDLKIEYLNTINDNYSWMYNDKMNLTLTDDLDSYLTVSLLLQYRPNWKVTQFYDYSKGLYCKEGFKVNKDTQVGVDISLVKGKCISNHMSVLHNRDHINNDDLNMNIINNVTANTYKRKYNLSSFLLIASLLGHKFEDERARRLSLLPDSSFLPYYYGDKTFEHIQKNYLFDMGFKDIYESQQDMTRQNFHDGQKFLNSKAKLFVDGSEKLQFNNNIPIKQICEYLFVEYDPSILEGFFKLKELHQGIEVPKYKIPIPKTDMYAFTVINTNNVKYMTKII